jgi:Ca2+-binding EF-hand superfamily protein
MKPQSVGQLTPLWRLQVQALFEQMDTDKDGNLDAKELRKALKAFGYSLSDAEVDQLMSRMDLNMDGALFPLACCEQCSGCSQVVGICSTAVRE